MYEKIIKRVLDIVLCSFALIVLLPVFIITAIGIKISSPGPVFYFSYRTSKGHRKFRFYKFRSMKIDAPRDTATSVLGDASQYMTRTGKVLRKLSLDELPQLFCCLVGTMSFIGPRPLVLNEMKCHDMRERLGVYRMRPGISGYAQVNGRDDVYYKNKAIMDAEYVRDASLWLDLKLMFQTVIVVFKRKGNNTGKRRKKRRVAKSKK